MELDAWSMYEGRKKFIYIRVKICLFKHLDTKNVEEENGIFSENYNIRARLQI